MLLFLTEGMGMTLKSTRDNSGHSGQPYKQELGSVPTSRKQSGQLGTVSPTQIGTQPNRRAVELAVDFAPGGTESMSWLAMETA